MPLPIAHKRSRIAAAAVVVITALAALLAPLQVGAAPIDDKRKKASALEAEINENAVKLSALNEQIKTAEDLLDEANATIADAQQRIELAKVENDRLEGLLRERAAAIYRSATRGSDTSLFDLDIRTLASREAYSDAAASRDNTLMDQLDAAQEDLAARQREAESAREVAADQKAQLEATKADFESSNAERERLLRQVNGEIKTLVDQAAAARRAAEAPKGGVPALSSLPPAGSGGASAAVAFAMAQVGVPYCTGGRGPDCYDCSGLTSTAWAAGGLTIPRTSGTQGAAFPRVPLGQLQPGDLITTSSWSSHVGIWVGGGYVHATHTGSDVKYVAGSGSVRDAVRPN